MDKKKIVGIFADYTPGEDRLLELIKARYEKIGLGAEFYCKSIEHLAHLFKYKPGNKNITTVHLPYEIDLAKADSMETMSQYLRDFGKKTYGFVVHDQPGYYKEPQILKENLNILDKEGGKIFIEYAAFADLEQFHALFKSLENFKNISACLDTGHISLRIAHDIFRKKSGGRSIFDLREGNKHFGELPKFLPMIEESCRETFPRFIEYIAQFRSDKPLHYHLHDAHPLSKTHPHGLSDHQTFFGGAGIKVSEKESIKIPKLIGEANLKTLLSAIDGEKTSINLEVHPDHSREELGAYKKMIFRNADQNTVAAGEIVNAGVSLIERLHAFIA